MKDFIFIDESGDAGKLGVADSSLYYQLNILHLNDYGLRKIIEYFSDFRYFHKFGKELKSEHINNKINKKNIVNIANWIFKSDICNFTSVYLNKELYQGPYLLEGSYGGYDSEKFKNYIIRRGLERHFFIYDLFSEQVEIVIDRFQNKRQEENLYKYLKKNYQLPSFENIIQADSRYVEGLQVVDLLGKLVKKKYLDNKDFRFRIGEICCINDIDKDFPHV